MGPGATSPRPDAVRRWPVAVVLGGAMFLVLFDSLAVATALPQIGTEFQIRPVDLQWVVTLYSLSIGGFLLLGGRICDLWGRRRILELSLALSTAGLLVAGVAPALWVLLVGRVMQGVGAAFALPAAMASAGTLFPDEPWRSRVFSVLAAAGNTAGLAGAVCGGLITSQFGWRWIFLAVAPVGALATVAVRLLLPADESRPADRERLDLAGAVLATVGLLALICGATRIGAGGPGPAGPLSAVAGLLMLAVLVRIEQRSPAPLVKPALLRSPRLVASCLAFGAHCAAYAVIVVVGSLYLQDVHHLSAARTGLVLAPVLLASFAGAVTVGGAIRRYGPRVVVSTALGGCALALTMLGLTVGHGSLTTVVLWLTVWGLSSGPVYVGLSAESMRDARASDRGTASALFESTSHVGGAIAVALYLTLLAAGSDYGAIQFVGAGLTAASVVTTLLIMPRREARALLQTSG